MAKRPNTAAVFVANMKALLESTGMSTTDLAKTSGVSLRMVNYILTGERKPSAEVADAIGRAFGVTGWQMLIPSLNVDLARRGKLEQLVERYSVADEQAQDYIDLIAKREANGGK